MESVSPWEMYFFYACKVAEIPVEPFDGKYGVRWARSPDKWYTPHFYLPDICDGGLAVQVVGDRHAARLDDSIRWATYREDGRKLAILDHRTLRCESPASFRSFLRHYIGAEFAVPFGAPQPMT